MRLSQVVASVLLLGSSLPVLGGLPTFLKSTDGKSPYETMQTAWERSFPALTESYLPDCFADAGFNTSLYSMVTVSSDSKFDLLVSNPRVCYFDILSKEGTDLGPLLGEGSRLKGVTSFSDDQLAEIRKNAFPETKAREHARAGYSNFRSEKSVVNGSTVYTYFYDAQSGEEVGYKIVMEIRKYRTTELIAKVTISLNDQVQNVFYHYIWK